MSTKLNINAIPDKGIGPDKLTEEYIVKGTNSDVDYVSKEGHYSPSSETYTATTGTALNFSDKVITGIKKDSKGHIVEVTTSALPSKVDASLLTGTIDLDRLPQGALERMVVVANATERYALTESDVQKGDTVKQEDTGVMYYVIDTSKLSDDTGYEIYTAGTATSVPWSGVTGKPTTLSGYGITDAYTSSQVDNKLAGYLPLSGGTLTGAVTANKSLTVKGSSAAWSGAVIQPCIYADYSSYGAIFSAPTKNGRITLSTFPYLGDFLYFGYYKNTSTANALDVTMSWDAENNILTASKFVGDLQGVANSVIIGDGSANNVYRPIVVHNGKSLYSAGSAEGKPQYNYSTGDVKATSFTALSTVNVGSSYIQYNSTTGCLEIIA